MQQLIQKIYRINNEIADKEPWWHTNSSRGTTTVQAPIQGPSFPGDHTGHSNHELPEVGLSMDSGVRTAVQKNKEDR